jgi:hypothetical protein
MEIDKFYYSNGLLHSLRPQWPNRPRLSSHGPCEAFGLAPWLERKLCALTMHWPWPEHRGGEAVAG